ncbi:MAG: zinc ribbon domain-containing protein [Acidobacteriota bacterium]
MPIFEYRCSNCDTTFERIIFGKAKNIHCPNCEGKEIEQLLSTFAVSGTSAGNSQSKATEACGSGRFT